MAIKLDPSAETRFELASQSRELPFLFSACCPRRLRLNRWSSLRHQIPLHKEGTLKPPSSPSILAPWQIGPLCKALRPLEDKLPCSRPNYPRPNSCQWAYKRLGPDKVAEHRQKTTAELFQIPTPWREGTSNFGSIPASRWDPGDPLTVLTPEHATITGTGPHYIVVNICAP